MGVTRAELQKKRLTDLLDRTFLAHLSSEEQDTVLAAMEWRKYKPGAVMIEINQPGEGTDLLVKGQVVVMMPGQAGALREVATPKVGALLGERALFHRIPTTAQVVAESEVASLHLAAEAFYQLLGSIEPFRRYIEKLAELRAEWSTIKEILQRNPHLGFLPPRDLEQLLNSGSLVHLKAGERLISAGASSTDVYVVLRGMLNVYAPQSDGPRKLLSVQRPGELNGIAAVMLEVPRIADVEAQAQAEVLRLSGEDFLRVINTNPLVRRRLMQSMATLNTDAVAMVKEQAKRMVAFICGARRKLGTTTFSYAVAAQLRAAGRVTLLDLDGARTAATLKLGVDDVELAGVKAQELHAPEGWGIQVLWPRDAADTVKLLKAMRDQPGRARGRLLVSGEPDAKLRDEVFAEVDALIYVRNASDSADPPEARDKTLFQAVYLEPDVPIDVTTCSKAVRLVRDPGATSQFWREGALEILIDNQSFIGRASARMARLLRGRSVGLALGGGGALGFAHVGLLRVLTRPDVGFPIDYVAGVSFGSLVAGLFVGGGMPALERLIRDRMWLQMRVAGCLVDPRLIGNYVTKKTNNARLGSTEIPFLPVGLDMESGQEYVLADGTLGEGVMSSSCMPGAFPAMRTGERRLVDGGVINNVPATVVWQAGADFILASNIIPANPCGKGLMGRLPFQRLFASTVGRLDDLISGMYMLMSQTGRDRALMADFVFDPDLERYDVYSFNKAVEIAQKGEEEGERVLSRIKEAYQKDQSIRF